MLVSSDKKPLLSVITVTYNDVYGLSSTIKSIVSIKDVDLEFIIVDGGSNDSTRDLIRSSQYLINKWISESDNSIFDAMNKGIELASGKWLIFINSGDEVRFSTHIVNRLNSYESSAIVYGNTERNNGLITKPHKLSMIVSGGLPMCHQSTFYNTEVLKDQMYYDTKYSFFGENELLMRIYKQGFKMKYIPETISYFQGGGVSDRISWETRKARYYYLWKHFGMKGVINGLMMKLGLTKYK